MVLFYNEKSKPNSRNTNVVLIYVYCDRCFEDDGTSDWEFWHKFSLITRKPVFGVCDQVRLKPICSATEASQNHEIANVQTKEIILCSQWEQRCWSGCASSDWADAHPQTARMRMLICVIVVCIWHEQVFSWRGSIEFIPNLSINCQTEINWFWNCSQTPTNWNVDLK